MAKGKIVITDYEYDDIRQEREVVAAAGLILEDYQALKPEEVIPLVRDADVVITQYSDMNRQVIESLTRCKAIVRYGIGINNIDVQAATDCGIYVCNVPDYGVDEVTNHAVALLFALSRKICLQSEGVKNGKWGYQMAVPIYRMAGQTLGIIGFGRMGRTVAKKMSVFGLSIAAYDPYLSDDEIRQNGAQPVGLEQLLRTSDMVTLHIPLNTDTRDLLDERTLSLMKPTAYLVNTARGGIINEGALVKALSEQKIAGAGLDVFDEEPIGPGSALASFPNVLLTSHTAWYSEQSQAALQRMAAEVAVHALTNEVPMNVCNPELLKKQ